MAPVIEVHVEKCQVRRRIPIAETVVELDAIDDLNAPEEVDVL